jgi:phosphatidylethanolamine/phosphatidyl-N-methylethanolamine N-methyltransferase
MRRITRRTGSRTGLLAPVYDRLIAPFERRSLGRWRRLTWAAVGDGNPGLEIGAGTGANFSFCPPGARVVGSDVSPRMLARARVKPDRADTPLLAVDVQSLPFADGSFAWVAATLVFCEVPDPGLGLREVRRVLRPGGTLVLLEHVRPGGWLGRVADALSVLTAPTWGEHFNRETIAEVRAAGFVIRSLRPLWRDVVVLIEAVRPL